MRAYRLPLLALFLVLAACATSVAIRDSTPTLRVTNHLAVPLIVRLDGRYVGRAYPGVSCLRLRMMPSASATLSLRALAETEATEAPAAAFASQPGWSISFGRTPTLDVLSLQPAPRCDAKR